MRDRIKRITGSLYWRQFMLTAGMVLLTMALLGVSFYALSYNYTVSEKRQEMRDRALLVAQLSVDYFTAGDDAERAQEDALRSLASVASRVTDVNFLICNTDGAVLLTTDPSLGGKSLTVPADITQTVLTGERLYEGRTTAGIYEKKQFVVGVPMTDSEGTTLGLVLAVMNSAELTQMWRSFIALFFMTSAIILVMAFVVSFLTSMRQIQPLTEMVKATRAYAGGDFDVRMQETGDCGEIGELAAAFNAMADSLQETERQRRDFIANVSHELKTPLQSISGYSELLMRGMAKDEDIQPFAQRIYGETQRLIQLVEDIINLSQLDEGSGYQWQQVNLYAIAAEVTGSLEHCAEEKQVRLALEGGDATLRGVPELLRGIVYNLTDNAIKYNRTGGSVTVTVAQEKDAAVLTVSDTGIGIPEEERNRIFERFYRVDKSRSKEVGGTGLGLSIVKHAAFLHKAAIDVTSQLGAGTSIQVRFPLQ